MLDNQVYAESLIFFVVVSALEAYSWHPKNSRQAFYRHDFTSLCC